MMTIIVIVAHKSCIVYIKGSIILDHPYVKVFFGRKKTVRSKSVPKMAVFRKFKGINRIYSHREPLKGTSLQGTTPFDVFYVNRIEWGKTPSVGNTPPYYFQLYAMF